MRGYGERTIDRRIYKLNHYGNNNLTKKNVEKRLERVGTNLKSFILSFNFVSDACHEKMTKLKIKFILRSSYF